jgi:hypothetical protein
MGVGQWREQRDLLVGNRDPGGAELLDNATHVDGIPHQDRITQEAQATRFVQRLGFFIFPIPEAPVNQG